MVPPAVRTLTRAVAAAAVGVAGIYHGGADSAPCGSSLYCYGRILEEVQLARPFADSKTFVDMPTRKPLDEVLAAWDALRHPVEDGAELEGFLREHFQAAGSELVVLSGDAAAGLAADPAFLDGLGNAVVAEFVAEVVEIWPYLTRTLNDSAVCGACETSLIPPRRPFVVAGGRFREPYYWDSYWIIQGLLRTGGGYTQIARNQIENFLDNVEEFGFVPNGARKYYLNRSQPPLLSQMVRIYVDYTGDTSVLDRALPLLVKEHEFFEANRSVDVTVGGQTYTLNRYSVDNNQPRPESFYEDYQQANNLTFVAATGQAYPAESLSQAERDLLYQNLASGAESGWDFSSRFLRRPRDAAEGAGVFPLRSLNVVGVVPVDLNAILYWNEHAIAGFHDAAGRPAAHAAHWADRARRRADAMHAVLWSEDLGTYLDYNLTSGALEAFTARDADALPFETDQATSADAQLAFNVAQLLPFLTGAAVPAVRDDPAAVRRAFDRVARYLDARAGGIAPTNFRSGQQWDQPSVWPPHMQMLIEALLLRSAGGSNDTGTGAADDDGTSTAQDDEDRLWAQDLALRLGQRYLDSAYCTWRATGGSTPASPKLNSVVNTTADRGGIMFEKYSDASISQAGGGGEYEVVAGFGWTNGVLIWVVDTFGDRLRSPPCLGVDYTFPEPDP